MAHIARDIAEAGGWISFARYMELALYSPALGYYSAGATKLGAAGDFTTAPELSALFGATLAQQVAQVLKGTGGTVLELGAGSGKLARDMLLTLDHLGTLPERYEILELSAELAQRQQILLAQLPAHLSSRIQWLDRLPGDINGMVIGNEVLDALPVHLLTWRNNDVLERGVCVTHSKLQWRDRPIRDAPLMSIAGALNVPSPYVTEINLAACALVQTLAQRLIRGALLFIDYGFGAAEYYHPQRTQGTLMCHYRHRAHGDPFFYPGLQDITAHVDFTSIAQAGVEGGLDMAGYTTQARFLANLGITDLLSHTDPGSVEYTKVIAPVQKLLSPSEMGELFKVIALRKNLDLPLIGFGAGDLSRLL